MNKHGAEVPLIEVHVVPRARVNKVVRLAENVYKINVTVVPEKGKANDVVITLLADYLNVSKSDLSIVRGEKSACKFLALKRAVA